MAWLVEAIEVQEVGLGEILDQRLVVGLEQVEHRLACASWSAGRRRRQRR